MRFVRRKDADPIPENARFFDQRAWSRFTRVVEQDLTARGVRFDRQGLLLVEHPPSSRQFGLINLAQLCNQHPSDRWTDIVRDHFDNLLAAMDVTDPHVDDVRSSIKVRLLPDDTVTGKGLVRPFAESIVAALVVDLPRTIQGVGDAELSAWGLTKNEAFDLGFANSRHEPVETRTIRATPDVSLAAIIGDSFFTTTHVTHLDDVLPGLPAAGALVGLPHRHMILARPMHDLSVMSAITQLVHMTRRFYDEGPGSLSRHIYWWVAGTLRFLPASLTDGKIEFYPPDDFLQAVQSLPEPPGA